MLDPFIEIEIDRIDNASADLAERLSLLG